jgi:hypothetical protein
VKGAVQIPAHYYFFIFFNAHTKIRPSSETSTHTQRELQRRRGAVIVHALGQEPSLLEAKQKERERERKKEGVL